MAAQFTIVADLFAFLFFFCFFHKCHVCLSTTESEVLFFPNVFKAGEDLQAASVSVRPRPCLEDLSCTFRFFHRHHVAIRAAAHWNPVDVFQLYYKAVVFLYSTSLCNRSLYSTLICKVSGVSFRSLACSDLLCLLWSCSEVMDVKLRVWLRVSTAASFSGLTV